MRSMAHRSGAAVSAAAGVALWILIGTATADAQDARRVEGGDAAVDGSFLRPYTNRWTFSIERPGSAPVEAGVWTDAMESVSYRGRPALKRTQVAEYKKGIRITFVDVFDPKSMALHVFDYTRSDNGESRHLESEDRTIRFERKPGTADDFAQDYVATVEHRVLDFYDGMYGILVDAFPLREGYEVDFSGFDTDRAAVDWIHLRVTGRETVPAGKGKTADTWVVQIETKLYGSSTWWLSREAPYVIQATLVLPEKDGGARIHYTMV